MYVKKREKITLVPNLLGIPVRGDANNTFVNICKHQMASIVSNGKPASIVVVWLAVSSKRKNTGEIFLKVEKIHFNWWNDTVEKCS